MSPRVQLTAGEIAYRVGGELIGSAERPVTGVERLDAAGPSEITFIRDPKHAPGWAPSRAGVALIGPGVQVEAGDRAVIRVPDADLALALVLELFAPPVVRPAAGIHPSAVVEPTAIIEAGAAIGALCYVGGRVRVGARTVLHPHVTLLDSASVGADSELYPGVVIGQRCEVGERAILHPNVVIGGDGFGYRPAPDGRGLVKIPQIGVVKIGNGVEIGAGTCVDRAKFSATLIGDGTKIDNLCQIGHNCVIGRMVVIAGNAGLAGSVTVGDGAMIGGCAIIRDHIHIGDGARVAGAAAVMQDVPDGETVSGYPARDHREALREYAALRKLPELVKLMRNSQKPEGKRQ
jgi:UDP-3-O-[3-hydroxymyristoyl] glucosamine N-acyltransferase